MYRCSFALQMTDKYTRLEALIELTPLSMPLVKFLLWKKEKSSVIHVQIQFLVACYRQQTVMEQYI